MRKNLLFILIYSAFVYSCTNAPTPENTKTDATVVNKETSQPIVTTEKPIDTTPPEKDEQNDMISYTDVIKCSKIGINPNKGAHLFSLVQVEFLLVLSQAN